MKAAHIMTSPVITVTPDTLVRDVAKLLAEKRISAVPVVDGDERLVGIVSEADLLHRYEIGADRSAPESWWQRIFSGDSSPDDYVRSHAVRVRDIMAREVVCASPDAPLSEIASMLEKHHVKRVPVVDAGRLCGIVSRADFVRAMAATGRNAAAPRSDEDIRTALVAELDRQSWWRPEFTWVAVEDGIVTYRGLMPLADGRAAARVAAEAIPGVREVRDLRAQFHAPWIGG